jgi:retron-type reverse transcriptase
LATLAAVISPANLWAVLMKMAARNGQAPGVDGVRHHDLSKGEWFELFRELRKAILAGTYRPQPLREVEIDKPDGGTRTLKLAVIIDRVIEKALADAITPAAEKIFSNCSYGFRPGRDRFGMLAVLKSWCETHGLWVITADDAKKAFDHVPVAAAVAALRRLGIDPALVTLVEIFLRGHEQREVGIAQGGALSPLILNLLLHSALDLPMTVACGGHEPVRYLRYADNLVVLTRTEEEGRAELERMRTLLSEVGLTLKGAPGTPRDLSQGEHLDLLGLRLTRTGETLTFEIPDHKWDDLQTKLVEAHTESNPTGTARSLVSGWIQAHAPIFINDRRTHDETVDQMTHLLRNTGHDHALTHNQTARTILTAAEKWEKVVSETRSRMTPGSTTLSTTIGMTALPNAVRQDHQELDGHTAESPQDAPAQNQTGGASRGGPVGVSGSPTTPSPSSTLSHSSTTSSSGTPFRPSGRSTALPGRPTAPPSAHHRRPRSSHAAKSRYRTHQLRHRSWRRLTPARPPPRPP